MSYAFLSNNILIVQLYLYILIHETYFLFKNSRKVSFDKPFVTIFIWNSTQLVNIVITWAEEYEKLVLYNVSISTIMTLYYIVSLIPSVNNYPFHFNWQRFLQIYVWFIILAT